jgi:hypothetical protein
MLAIQRDQMQTYYMPFTQLITRLPAYSRLTRGSQRIWHQVGNAWRFAILGAVLLSAGLSIRFSAPQKWIIFAPLNLTALLLGIGGTLFGLSPVIKKTSIRVVRIGLRGAWYGAAFGLFLIELGGWAAMFKIIRVVANDIAISGFSILIFSPGLIYVIIINIIGYRLSSVLTTRNLILSAAIAFFLIAWPPVLAYLATNGSYGVPLLGPGMSGVSESASALFLAAVPVFVLYCPDFISRERPWSETKKCLRSFVTWWLSGIATASTMAYGFTLHFSNSSLSHIPLSVVIVTNLIAAIFLRPLYKSIVVACWKWGVADAVMLRSWRAEQKDAWLKFRKDWQEQVMQAEKATNRTNLTPDAASHPNTDNN